MNLEDRIKLIIEQCSLTKNEINTRVSKIVSDLSGLIDFEGGLLLLSKQLGLEDPIPKDPIHTPIIITHHVISNSNKMIFIDIDENINEAIDHLRTHTHVLTRKSVNGNSHAIVFDSCGQCLIFNDEQYEGKIFFNNKGGRWAELEWVNLQTNKPENVESENLVHILLRIIDDDQNTVLRHIYTDIWYFRLNFEDMIPNPEFIEQQVEIYYTFHSVVSNTSERYWECKDQSGDKDQRFEELMKAYQFTKYDSFGQFFHDYVNFLTHLPQEVID